MQITAKCLQQGYNLDQDVWVYALDMGNYVTKPDRKISPTLARTKTVGSDRLNLYGKKGKLLKGNTLLRSGGYHSSETLKVFDNEAECVAEYIKELMLINDRIRTYRVESVNFMTRAIRSHTEEIQELKNG